MNAVPKLPDHAFRHENAAASNGVFLIGAKNEPPFMGAVEGWKIVGWGTPPWPKEDSHIAIMCEKVTPAESYGGSKGEEMPEGTRIWHHGITDWVPGLSRYEKRMERGTQ